MSEISLNGTEIIDVQFSDVPLAKETAAASKQDNEPIVSCNDLYKDYGIVRGLPADTIICLRAPYEGLGHSVDDAKYQFEMETFKAFVSYASDTANSVESATDTDTAVNEKKEEEAA